MERAFSNEALLFDFFQEAMSGIVLAHTALDNFANELLPEDFEYTDPDGGKTKSRLDLESNTGLELRLSRVASQATGRPNLRQEDPDLWGQVIMLKALRDDISHAKRDHGYSGTDGSQTIFSRLLKADDLNAHSETVEAAMAFYADSGDETTSQA